MITKSLITLVLTTFLIACGDGAMPIVCEDMDASVPDGTIIEYPDASTGPYAIGPERLLYADAEAFCDSLGGHIVTFDNGGEFQAFFTNAWDTAKGGTPVWTNQPFRLTNGHAATYVLTGNGQQLPVDLTAWGEDIFTARPYCELED